MNQEFDEQYQIKNKIDLGIWRKIIKMVFVYKKLLILFMVSIAIVAVVETLFTYQIALAIDKYFPLEGGITDSEGLTQMMLLLIALTLTQALFVFFFIRAGGKLEYQFYKKITSATFAHIQELPFAFFDTNSVGWLMARITTDTERIGQVITWGVIDLVWAAVKLLVIFILLMIKNPLLALIMIVFVPCLLFVGLFFRKIIIIYFRKLRKANSLITGQLNEGITGAKVTKSLAIEPMYQKEFAELTGNYRRISNRSALFTTLYYQSIAFLTGLAVALTGLIGGNMVISGFLTYSILYLFVESMRAFFEPVLNFASVSNDLKHAQVAAERVLNILELNPEISDRPEVIAKYGTSSQMITDNWEELIGRVDFVDVSFSYLPDEPVLEHFSLSVQPGQSVAIVGETGAGKTTIVNLLCRFYQPTSGQILIDEKPIDDRSLAWLHKNLGYVQQVPHLFSGTILDNIRYGRVEASDEEVYDIARQIGADKFINQLEKGFLTEVGEGGSRLSQGQKQLISIARALIAQPKLIVLDEATSSVDTETEFYLQQAVLTLLQGRTSFVIAHRLSTIVQSDLILVLKKGKVVESGSHQELIKQRGYYYQLYTSQYINQEMEKLAQQKKEPELLD